MSPQGIRVLLVTPSLAPDWGGPVAWIRSLLPALRELEVELVLVTTSGARSGTPDDFPGTTVRTVPEGRFGRVWPGFSLGLPMEVERASRTTDILHVSELWNFGHVAAALTRLRHRMPLVVSLHGQLMPWAVQHRGARKGAYGWAIQNPLLRHASAVHALSKAEVSHARARGVPASRIRAIPNGVDHTAFEQVRREREARATLGAGPILYLGRMHPVKGPDILLRSFANVLTRDPERQLILAGPDEGGMSAVLAADASALGIGDRVKFVGPVDDSQRALLLAEASILVAPSRSEGLSMTILEGLAAAVPIVATSPAQVSGAVGIIEVAPPEAYPLAQAIERSLRRPINDSAARAREGLRLVKTRYSPLAVATQFRKLYEGVLSDR